MKPAFTESDYGQFTENIADAMRVINRERFALVGASPAADAHIDELQQRLGMPVPPVAREIFKSQLNGLVVIAHEEFWPAPQMYDVRPHWQFLSGLALFAIGDDPDTPAWVSIEEGLSILAEFGIDQPLWPVLRLQHSATPLYCIDATGTLVVIDDEGMAPAELTLAEALSAEITFLMERGEEWAGLEPEAEAGTATQAQLAEDNQRRYDDFVTNVARGGTAYTLRGENGVGAIVESTQDDGVPVLCFWSNDTAAWMGTLDEAWASLEVWPIGLADFLEHWCVGMHNDGALVGVQFDENLFGREVEPLELALSLAQECLRIERPVELQRHGSLQEFVEAAQEAIASDPES